MDSVNLTAIALLQEQLRDAKGFINALETEIARQKSLIADIHINNSTMTDYKRLYEQKHLPYKKLQEENRALRIQLRAANKGAERNAHKLRTVVKNLTAMTLGNPPIELVRLTLTRIAEDFDL